MLCLPKGSITTVTVTRDEVAAFADEWPCAHFLDRSVTFTFNKSNGDLVDISGAWYDCGADESALGALADDAKAYARSLGRVA